MCLMIDKPEDQFTLSSGISCAAQTVHVASFHQLLQDPELLLC
jgi:hypothetical protein